MARLRRRRKDKRLKPLSPAIRIRMDYEPPYRRDFPVTDRDGKPSQEATHEQLRLF